MKELENYTSLPKAAKELGYTYQYLWMRANYDKANPLFIKTIKIGDRLFISKKQVEKLKKAKEIMNLKINK